MSVFIILLTFESWFCVRVSVYVPEETDWIDKGIVLEAGPVGSWDVRLHGMITPCSVVKKHGIYFLYYLGADGDRGPPHNDGGPRHRALGVATSIDGIHFTKYDGNPIITYRPNNNEEEGIFSAGATLDENGNVVLYAGCMDAGPDPSSTNVDGDVRLYISSDGFRFDDCGDVLSHKNSSVWGYGDEIFPVGTFHANGQWHVYYVAKGYNNIMWDIGLAWGSDKSSLTQSEEVLSASSIISSCEPILIEPEKVALFFNYEFVKEIEVRTVSLDSPSNVSQALERYTINGRDGCTIFLDRETNTWFLYYLDSTSNSIKVKTALAKIRVYMKDIATIAKFFGQNIPPAPSGAHGALGDQLCE